MSRTVVVDWLHWLVGLLTPCAEKHETFFSELASADDGFDVVSDYMSRNIFNQLVVIGDKDEQPTAASKLSELEQRRALLQ